VRISRSRTRVALAGAVAIAVLSLPGASAALPSGRVYELVSPVFKGGFGAVGPMTSPDGDEATFYSPGSFAGAPAGPELLDYIARRSSAGWSTSPLMAPVSLVAVSSTEDVSPSLQTVLEIGHQGAGFDGKLPTIDVLTRPTQLPDVASNWELAAELESLNNDPRVGLHELGSDPSFCHLVVGPEPEDALLLPEAVGDPDPVLYILNRGCGGAPKSFALLGVTNKGGPLASGCGVGLGNIAYAVNGGDNTFNAVSEDGSEVFFTSCTSGQAKSESPHQLFLRAAGSRTVEVSRPLAEACAEVPCPQALKRGTAEYQGASAAGTRVFFTAPLESGQMPLVPGDADASNNLYMAAVGCPASKQGCAAAEREVTSLTEVSHDPNGGPANVFGVARVAPDGARVYFVAGGDLLSTAQMHALESEGRPLPRAGADNLYVYTGEGGVSSIEFVADLCAGSEQSGGVKDIRCPIGIGSDADLWSGPLVEAQTVGADGRFLVFATYAQLTADDTNAARDVYRYDAQTGALVRVSTGEGGHDANGNGGALGSSLTASRRGDSSSTTVALQYELGTRAVTEDGSRIVFVSAEPLSLKASNGLANVYEWHEQPGGGGGEVALVSAGSGPSPVQDVVISPNGLSVFFDTSDGLVPQDTDGANDVYDARLDAPGEAFSTALAEQRPCEGDACQGPLTNPAPLLVPGSVPQAPGENLTPSAPKKSKPKKCKSGYRRAAHGKCVKVKRAQRAAKGHRNGRGSTSGKRG